MAKGQFPKQIKLSERSSAWFTDEIYTWLEIKKNIRDADQSTISDG
jgi:predicted DNA-binding transcriptional regulator AlpA